MTKIFLHIFKEQQSSGKTSKWWMAFYNESVKHNENGYCVLMPY